MHGYSALHIVESLLYNQPNETITKNQTNSCTFASAFIIVIIKIIGVPQAVNITDIVIIMHLYPFPY